ncbi:MAG: DUF819 family protein [Saprospiraceae bacterium]|nr:DUF819 family protein [Saprospiraceae bacterium]
MSQVLIQPNQTLLLVTILVASAAIGILGDKYDWFGKVSGILITILITAILTTIDIIPSASDQSIEVAAYQFVYGSLVPISIPLLLFNAHLKKIIKESGRLLLLFLIGSFGVVAGAVLSFFLFPLGIEAYKIAAVFIGTYTGGSVNFMAVAATFDFVQSPLFTTVATVDNVFTNLFFLLLFLLPAFPVIRSKFITYDETYDVQAPLQKTEEPEMSPDFTMVPLIGSLLIALLVVILSRWLSDLLTSNLAIGIDLEILLITLVITLIANLFPRLLSRFEEVAFQMGMAMMFVFLATIGAACDLSVMLQTSFFIIGFAVVTLTIHLIIILIAGKQLKFSLEEVLIASMANAGGPSVAAPMAANFGMKKAVTPAILVGILGYAIGTFLGVGTGIILQ